MGWKRKKEHFSHPAFPPLSFWWPICSQNRVLTSDWKSVELRLRWAFSLPLLFLAFNSIFLFPGKIPLSSKGMEFSSWSFIMSSAYTLYPQVWIRHGLLPRLPKPLPYLKFACPFLFSSRGTLWDGKQIHPQPSVPSLKQAFPITLNSGKFISYASFWLFWFPGHSPCPFCHPLPTWVGKMACLS